MHVRHLHGAQNISRTWYISASAGSSYSQLDLGQHANHWSLKGPEKKKKENEQVIFFGRRITHGQLMQFFATSSKSLISNNPQAIHFLQLVVVIM